MEKLPRWRSAPLCDRDDVLEGVPRRHDLPGQSLIVVRARGEIRIFENRCPHRGTELDWLPGRLLDASGKHLQCATHGALFDTATGRCIAGPCAGQSLAAVSFRIDQGRIVIPACEPHG